MTLDPSQSRHKRVTPPVTKRRNLAGEVFHQKTRKRATSDLVEMQHFSGFGGFEFLFELARFVAGQKVGIEFFYCGRFGGSVWVCDYQNRY